MKQEANPPAGIGFGAGGIPHPVDWYCTKHQAYHPTGKPCQLESTSRNYRPPATFRWEQDNDHPGFAAQADTNTEPAAGPEPTGLTPARLARLAQAQAQDYLKRTIDMPPTGTTLRWDGRLWVYVTDASAYRMGWQAGYAAGYDRCGKDLAATDAFADAPPAGFCRVQDVAEYLLPHCGCVGACEQGLPGTPQPSMVGNRGP